MKNEATNRTTNHGRQESTGGNSGFAKAVARCNLEALCFYSSFVQVDSFKLRNPPLHQAPKRWQ